MKKLCLLILALILFAGCNESQEVQIHNGLSLQQHQPSTIHHNRIRINTLRACECNGRAYLPSSIEFAAFD
ncbi:hypothetical protein [Daejeonella sp.]|uniref:hypothetical protein n=1 Tax=Daejeonella sp. TaxID=2805397 RepID=UPI0025C6EFD8|nr:hypothetical protein [Daejeonella sp.]